MAGAVPRGRDQILIRGLVRHDEAGPVGGDAVGAEPHREHVLEEAGRGVRAVVCPGQQVLRAVPGQHRARLVAGGADHRHAVGVEQVPARVDARAVEIEVAVALVLPDHEVVGPIERDRRSADVVGSAERDPDPLGGPFEQHAVGTHPPAPDQVAGATGARDPVACDDEGIRPHHQIVLAVPRHAQVARIAVHDRAHPDADRLRGRAVAVEQHAPHHRARHAVAHVHPDDQEAVAARRDRGVVLVMVGGRPRPVRYRDRVREHRRGPRHSRGGEHAPSDADRNPQTQPPAQCPHHRDFITEPHAPPRDLRTFR